MRGAVKVIAGFTAAAVIGAVPAAGATPAGRGAKASQSAKTRRAGTSYFGATAAEGGVAIRISRDGRQVRQTVFAYKQTCTDGTTIFNWDANTGIPISTAGTFKTNYDSGPQTDAKFPGEVTRLVSSITGTINKSGSRIVGTARVTFTDVKAVGSYACDTGLIRYTASD